MDTMNGKIDKILDDDNEIKKLQSIDHVKIIAFLLFSLDFDYCRNKIIIIRCELSVPCVAIHKYPCKFGLQ